MGERVKRGAGEGCGKGGDGARSCVGNVIFGKVEVRVRFPSSGVRIPKKD